MLAHIIHWITNLWAIFGKCFGSFLEREKKYQILLNIAYKAKNKLKLFWKSGNSDVLLLKHEY